MTRRLRLALLGLAASTLVLGSPAIAKQPVTPPVWHPKLEQFSPPGERETEFGSALSDAGFRKLKAALPWEAGSERADYYFDAYDGRQFLLRTGGMPLKVRIKLKKQKPHWQVSRFVIKEQVKVGALSIKVHTTESWEGKLKGPEVQALLAASDRFASRLPAGGAPLRAAADEAQAAWLKLRADTPPPGLMVIDHYLKGHPYRFCPRKVTTAKARLSAMLPGFTNPAVKLMLGTEPEVDAKGRPVSTHELEAEADGPMTPAQSRAIALAIGHLMEKAGLTAADQAETETVSNAYTLQQLKK